VDRNALALSFLLVVQALLASALRAPAVRRAAVWYGDLMIRTMTLGARSADDARPVTRVLIGGLGIGGLAALAINVLYVLAKR
jgi:hypothetical protein